MNFKGAIMIRAIKIFFIISSFFFIPLQADERIGGTLNHVDLMIEDLYNEDGHNCGERYYAINRNDCCMRISIKLTKSMNVEDHLIDYTVILDSHKKVDLGFVVQKIVSDTSSWKYDWKAIEES